MGRLEFVFGICVAALGLAATATPAAAYKFTGTFAGGDCRQMAAQIQPARLWYGHFSGQRESIGFFGIIESRTVEGCFRSQGECENWLYQWRSEWQFNSWNDYCAQGWPPKPRGIRPRVQGQ